MRARYGGPLGPRSKAQLIRSARKFFYDLQEWEWIERRFDPRRAFALPRSIKALIGPDPRVIADDVWAKLMWAGPEPHRRRSPRPPGGIGPWYPLELVRAVATLWLFAGLRVDEILRLRVGAVRWQHRHSRRGRPAGSVPARRADEQDRDRVHQARRPAVGEAIEAWEAVRPTQPRFPDRKTGELVDMLLAYRGAQLGEKYVNRVLIPLLCRKAGRPARGRARLDHRPPRPRDDRQPALQRQGPDEPVRAAGLARAQLTAALPSTTRGSPRPS